ncbi:MAG: hypothetical protein V2A73_04250 [Pseudomonadota bacterium]
MPAGSNSGQRSKAAASIRAPFLVAVAAAVVAIVCPPPSAEGQAPVAKDVMLGGNHWRLETDRGVVHVWCPPGFSSRTAGIVVYVHGLYTDTDGAWTDHKLARQFAASRRNALFIVPEAPASAVEQPFWPSLDDLVDEALATTGLRRPNGALVVMGHSGAYRQIVLWLEHEQLDDIILLDALYGNEDDFRRWLERTEDGSCSADVLDTNANANANANANLSSTPNQHQVKQHRQHQQRHRPQHDRDPDHCNPGHDRHRRRLTLVTKSTKRWSTPFVRRLRYARQVDRVPRRLSDLGRSQRNARLLELKSQYGHMEIVTEGMVIPVVLERAPLRSLRTRAGKPPRRPRHPHR